MTTTANPADVANRLQTFFSKKLLQHQVNNLRLNEFGMKADLPQKMKSKTIRWFRKRVADSSRVQSLSEGVALSTYAEFNLDYVEATLAQLGELFKLSDVLQMIDAYEPLKMAVSSMGEDAALKADDVTRDAIISGALNSDDATNGTEIFAGVTPTADSSTDFASLLALDAANAKMTRARALGCKTGLKVNLAPQINGRYIGVIAPQITHDLVQDDDWLKPHQYKDTEALYKGEVGELDGIRYVEATNPFIEDATYGTYSASGGIFSTFIFGRDAFGVPKMAGTSSPWAPRVVILDKADKTDPLNQYVMAGWKAFYTSKLLNEDFIKVLRTKSTFGS